MQVLLRMVSLRAFFVLLLLSSIPLFGQAERGTLAGVVTDKSGAVIPGAKVVVTNTATNTTFTTESNDLGQYTVPNLSPGTYSARVEKEGFRPAVTSSITIDAGANVRNDVSLEVGASTQAIEVKAEAVALQTDNAKSQTVITDKLIGDLPTVVGGNLRSPFDLAILTPESKNFGDNNFQIGGGQAASFGVNLDGISANTTRALSNSWVATNTPSLEALTEFTVETNGFKAEYGNAGGGAINFISKSGTNDFHGDVYEYARNDDFDARGFFEARRRIYKQHDFGGTIGGPVWLPKIYNGRNKTFFFASYEGFRNRNGATSTRSTVPTPEMLDGDFHNWVDASGKMLQIYDPFSLHDGVRDPFVGNIIPKSRFDPQSVKAIQAFSSGPGGAIKPNNGASPGTVDYILNNYIINNGSLIQPADKFSVKMDQYIKEKDHITFYFGWNRNLETPGPNGPPTLPGYYTSYNDLNQASNVYRFTWDHNFTPTLLNHFRGGGNDWAQSHNSPQELIGHWKDKFCMGNAPDCDYSLGEIRFDENYTKWGADANNGSENNIYSFADDLTKIKGAHTIKFGGMYQHGQYNGFGRQCVMGCANFSFIGTGAAGVTNQAAAGGNAFASFLLGWATNGQIDTVRYIGQNWPYWAGYVQDDWRVTQRLTVNLGLRWETALPPYEEKDRWSDLSLTTPNPGADNRLGALIYAGSGPGRQGSRTLADSWFWGFGPRIGLAYNFGDKTVIRASFARSFSQVTTTTGSTHQKGFTQTTSFPNSSNGLSPSFLLKDGLPPYPVPPFISPSFQNGKDMPWWQNGEVSRLPEQLNFNFSIQRQLTSSLVVDLGYNGVVGTHLQSGILNYNQLPFSVLQRYGPQTLALNFNKPADAATLAAMGFSVPYSNFVKDFGNNATLAQALRPLPQYTDIDTWNGAGDHSGHSSYHALIVKMDKRYASGLAFTSSYVFSKLLTDSDSYWITDQARAADQYNRRLEKSIGAYDVTHNFKLGLTYELPFGPGKKMLNSGPLAWLAGGWRIASIQLYSSGRPVPISGGTGLNIFSGRLPAFITSYDNWQPKWANGSFDPNVDRFFNRAAFPNQNVLAIGNSTRFNPKLREFPNYTENLSIAKVFRFKERFSAELRGEAFNLLNRVRFGYGNANVNSADFGKVTSTLNSPRQIQIGAKILF
ncbi:MAG TPA: TonB-dependent receptor [Bryobacteraceae bacterium]|nr:TonB-dependent receptor [Bryobacteraceae bacterium]